MKLIVGLGNPGKPYAANRHNVGFQCLDRLSRLHNIPIKERRLRGWGLKAKFGVGEIAGVPVALAKPLTYMNLSGGAVARMVRRFGVALNDIIVVYDDMDLPPGTLRIRQRGGAGGHKGVSSIIKALGSDEFPRIRVGIGRPDGDEISHVLGDFSAAEAETMRESVDRVAEVVGCILAEGLEAAMNRYN